MSAHARRSGLPVLIPHLRGYGTTRFLLSAACATVSHRRWPSISRIFWTLSRSRGNPVRLRLGGGDANIFGRLAERSKEWSREGYLIGNQEAGRQPLPRGPVRMVVPILILPVTVAVSATKIPARIFEADLEARFPKWQFDDATFNRSAAAFDTPDHVDIVIHNYAGSWAWLRATEYDDLENRLAQSPVIASDITMEGDANGAPHRIPAAYAKNSLGNTSTGKSREARAHLPQEAPQALPRLSWTLHKLIVASEPFANTPQHRRCRNLV